MGFAFVVGSYLLEVLAELDPHYLQLLPFQKGNGNIF
jgi:hypothetical protein